MQNNEFQSIPPTIYKKKLNVDPTPKCNSKIIKFLEKNIGKNICGLWLGKAFLGMKPKAQPIKEQIQLHQN